MHAERNPPIDEVIKQNVIPQFVVFLRRADMPQLQVRNWQILHVQPACKRAAAGQAASGRTAVLA
jgi:hypothetical protein